MVGKTDKLSREVPRQVAFVFPARAEWNRHMPCLTADMKWGKCRAPAGDAAHLPHGEETRVWGDQAYRGQSEVLREHAPHAQDFTHQRYRYKDRIDEVEREKNRTKSKVRSKVEHVFAVLKLKFGFVKVRYRGLDKNANRLFVSCALVNLFLVRKRLLYATAA